MMLTTEKIKIMKFRKGGGKAGKKIEGGGEKGLRR